MSTSSSAPAREREPEADPKTSPFPYSDAVVGVSTPATENAADERRQLEQAQLLAQSRLQGQQEVRVEEEELGFVWTDCSAPRGG